MSLNKLLMSDTMWLQTIRRCDVPKQQTLTTLLLMAGLVMAATILGLGIAYDNRGAISAGTTSGVATPIVCAARFNILRLYRIIQRLTEEQASV